MQTATRRVLKADRFFCRVPSLIIAILVRSEANLKRGVYAVLIPLRRYIAEGYKGEGRRDVLVEEIGQEDVESVALFSECQIVGLGAEFGADRELTAQQQRSRALELGGVAIVLVAAEPEDAELICAGLADRAVDQQALGKEQLGRGEVEIGAIGVPATDRMDGGTLIVHLVLRAGCDLRQPAVLVVDGVAHQLDLCAENVLLERKAGAEPELNAGRSRVERLAVIGEFDAVEEADRDAPAMEAILRQVDEGVVGIGADRIAR